MLVIKFFLSNAAVNSFADVRLRYKEEGEENQSKITLAPEESTVSSDKQSPGSEYICWFMILYRSNVQVDKPVDSSVHSENGELEVLDGPGKI